MLRRVVIFYILTSVAALSAALIIEHFFMEPACPLCMYQRYSYCAAIFFGILSFFKKYRCLFEVSVILSILVTCGIAIYHFMVLHKFVSLSNCSAQPFIELNTVEDILRDLDMHLEVPCDMPSFFIFGLSVPELSLIYAFSLIMCGILIIAYDCIVKKKNTFPSN